MGFTRSADEGRWSIRELRDRYDRLGRWLPIYEPIERHFLVSVRRRQFGGVAGRVLDVACGGGSNFEYVAPSAELVGVDLSPVMLEHADARLEALDLGGTLARMDAANLAFADDTFDTVISAFSTCTFPDPVAAVSEMARVCRPDGRIALLEHGESSRWPIAWLQDRYAGVHCRHFGCRLTQEPLEHPIDAGLTVERYRRDPLGILTAMDIRPVAGSPSANQS